MVSTENRLLDNSVYLYISGEVFRDAIVTCLLVIDRKYEVDVAVHVR